MITEEPLVSIGPTKISLYKKLHGLPPARFSFKAIQDREDYSNKQKGVVSKAAAKRIRDKVSWLAFLAQSKNKRITFITLTLPSAQRHSDNVIKKVCLNQFLTEVRQRFNVKYYVWKAEVQANDNIHFHLTTNVYIHHVALKSIWNRCVEKLGYVSSYHLKFCDLSEKEYVGLPFTGKRPSKETLKKRYASGQASNWMSPNTIDVREVRKVGNLANYLAKYLSKNPKAGTDNSDLDDRLSRFSGNLWYCSQALSKLKAYVTLRCNKAEAFVSEIMKAVGSKTVVYEHAVCCYFNYMGLPPPLKKTVTSFLNHQEA